MYGDREGVINAGITVVNLLAVQVVDRDMFRVGWGRKEEPPHAVDCDTDGEFGIKVQIVTRTVEPDTRGQKGRRDGQDPTILPEASETAM